MPRWVIFLVRRVNKMACNKIRARAEMKGISYNATQQERDHAFKILLTVFKRRCNDYGIMKSYKEHETFEKGPQKERRKRKEAAIRRQKDEMLQRSRKAKGKDYSK